MTTREHLLAELNRDLANIHAKIDLIKAMPVSGLDTLQVKATLWGRIIDFNNLSHDAIVEVIQAIPGKWDKQKSAGGNGDRIDYTNTLADGQQFRCWAGEPPPNCRIEEVEETIPAQPERKEIRRRLVCKEAE